MLLAYALGSTFYFKEILFKDDWAKGIWGINDGFKNRIVVH